ncbi:MAG: hypothetical protein BWY11_02335 [Firmicutes bacterium ADurb.Bin182]|nr:MAG: hypothetical protein BWY11_02335 [Firmicutes bacterium ADurb.Bin182]
MIPLFEKIKEVARTLLPVTILVMVLCFTIIDAEADIIIRFIVGSVMLLIGLSVFLWGVDLAMKPIGEQMSLEVAYSKSPFKIAVLGFLLGFLITVAEPDLLILGMQLEQASGGALNASAIVYLVSTGVGVMVSLGVFKLLQDKPLSAFMAITYGVILVLAFLVSEEFLAISFDASGATTGALTTPFVLALSLGLSKVKGGKHSEENSFGLVGIMSAGPVLAVMLMSVISGQKNIRGDMGEFVAAEGVLGPIINSIPAVFVESLIALLPISVLFFIFDFKKFKLSRDEISGIIKGLVFTLAGLTLFLAAVNSGFLDMGRIIGMEIAGLNRWMLIGTGFLLGLITVLVEPAVHVLGGQIEEVTGGHIPINLIRISLSIGVGIAIALSMVRIAVPEVKLWYFLLSGFAIAILLSFFSDPVFIGIAFDAGGVASGPMTATFVLAFAQGAAAVVDTANVLVDGFGVIAMVAMAPVLSIMILGTIFRHKKVEYPAVENKAFKAPHLLEEATVRHDCILAVIDRGFAEKVVDIARQAGAGGATIIHGRGVDENQKVKLPILQIELQPEKEIVLLITGAHVSACVADSLLRDAQLAENGKIAVYMSTTQAMAETIASGKDPGDSECDA